MKNLIKTEDVVEIIAFCKVKIWELQKNGQIPGAVKIGKSLRWDADKIYQWIHLECPNVRDFKYMLSSAKNIPTDPDRLICNKDLEKIIDISPPKLYDLRLLGKLPKPIKFNRTLRWRESDIHRWIDQYCPNLQQFEKIKKKKPKTAAPDNLVKNEYFLDYLNVSKGTLWSLEKSEQIPKAIRFGYTIRWKQSEIDQWIKSGCPDISNI